MEGAVRRRRVLGLFVSLLFVAGFTACATTSKQQPQGTPVPVDEVAGLLSGKWQGEWSARWATQPGKPGKVTFNLTSDKPGQIAGTGVATPSGNCPDTFDIKGSYQKQDISMKIFFTGACSGQDVSMAMQMMRTTAGELLLVGYWSQPDNKDFGYFFLTKNP
ncbi:MAG: hypothetical protein L0Z68_06635 [Gammaproteobacteria bacterium]|nr:hypothetical protein [Gammaproteobacteria bacterium]